MKITKIKYDGSRVQIEYTIKPAPDSKQKDEINAVFKSYDKPLESFVDSLQSLTSEVEEIADCLKQGACNGAKIIGVSLSWTQDIMGAVITAKIPVETANGPLILNTPHLPERSYNENSDSPVLPRTCKLKLDFLIDEALKYYNGEREKQEELFEENIS